MSLLAALATGAGTPVEPDPLLNRAVADRAGVYRHGTTSATQITYGQEHTVRRATTRIRLTYGSMWWSGSNQNLTIDGAAVVVAGTLYPLVFSGSAGVVITPGATATSDWVTVTLAPGDVIQSRTCFAADTLHPIQAWYSRLPRTIEPHGNYTLAGSGAIPTAEFGDNGRGPLVIEGETTSTGPSVAIMGDSIAEGADDANFPTGGQSKGFIPIGLFANDLPWTQYSVFADLVPGGAGIRREGRFGDTLALHTHAVSEYPINPINGADTFSTIANTLLELWAWAKAQGVEVWQTTVGPSNTSSDSWATLANQTITAKETKRVEFNDWVRDGCPTVSGASVAAGSVDPTAIRAGHIDHPLAGYIEVADTVESARNSGKWKVNGAANYLTDDGTHPSAAGHALMAAPISAWAATL